MSNIQFALLTKVIDEKAFHVLEKAQINESFFTSPEAAQIYRFMKETFHNPLSPGEIPSREMVAHRINSFYPFESADSAGVLANQLRLEKMRTDLLVLANDLMVKADLNPMEAIAALRTESSKLAALAEVGSDLTMAGVYQMVRERYEIVARAGGVIGVPFPWKPLNDVTQGAQGGQFIVIYGRPKSMKTWVAIDMAVHAYATSRRRVMFYTREMAPEQIAMRVAARLACVDYHKFKNGQLQPELKAHVFDILADLGHAETSAGAFGYRQPCFTIVSDRNAGGRGGGGVGWVQAKIREIDPDIVFVDGMYLMRDDRSNQRTVDWKAISHISQDLKLTSQEFNVPVIGITQANRGAEKSKGEDLTELAFSDAIGQDSDLVLRVTKKVVVDENTKQDKTELYITAPGFREGTFDGIVIRGEPATNFDYIRTLKNLDDVKDDYADNRGRGNNSNGGPAYGGQQSSFRRGGTAPNARMPMR